MTNAFFAFDNGVGRGTWSPQQQAETLRDLGYAGIGYTGTENLGERLKAFESRKLSIFSLYVPCYPGRKVPVPDGLIESMQPLEGTGIMLWLTVQEKCSDEDAVRVVGEIADAAGKYGVKVALYPHSGFHVATTRDAVRLVKKLDRKNVGLTINLCHELMAGNEADLAAIIKEAAPYLYLVSINGADHKGGWDKLIRPLGQGEFDVPAFLGNLKAAGYVGPIGLQCFNVAGDQRQNLKASMNSWRKMCSVAAAVKESE